MKYTKEQIIDCIHCAFPKGIVGNKPLITSLGYDVELTQNIEYYLMGKSWAEIDWLFINDEFMGEASYISCTLTPDAYKKYFPLYLFFV